MVLSDSLNVKKLKKDSLSNASGDLSKKTRGLFPPDPAWASFMYLNMKIRWIQSDFHSKLMYVRNTYWQDSFYVYSVKLYPEYLDSLNANLKIRNNNIKQLGFKSDLEYMGEDNEK